MTKSREVMLDLAGLTLAPSQVHGSVRLVPLLRAAPLPNLRLAMRDAATCGVSVKGRPDDPSVAYYAYIPHAFVLETQGKTVTASHGAQLGKRRDAARLVQKGVRLTHRMAKREGAHALRFLPLHVAMEGFLALHFGGADFMWSEYSRRAISRGLSPRSEYTFTGHAIAGLDEALRTFEIHPTQCGVLVFVADALASAFVVPHPDDYRALHDTLMEDMFSELLVRYGILHPWVQASRVELDASRIASFDDVARELEAAARDFSAYEQSLADGLFGRAVTSEPVSHAGPFVLERFRSDMAPDAENYLGERILDPAGHVQYMKVMRLSEAQARRAFLLMKLHAHEWHLARTAAALGVSWKELVERLEHAGFGYLLRNHLRPWPGAC
jgi:hypothetical protein